MSLISRATNIPRLTAPESGVPGKMGTKGKAISNLCKSAYGPKAKEGNIYTRSQMFLGKNCDGFSAGAPTQFVTSSQSAVREVPNHLYPTTGVFPTANSQSRTTSPQRGKASEVSQSFPLLCPILWVVLFQVVRVPVPKQPRARHRSLRPKWLTSLASPFCNNEILHQEK